MIKKVISLSLALVLLICAFPVTSHAVAPVQDEIEASYYLSEYGATLYSDGTTGKLKLAYQVYAKSTMSLVGVYRITVKKSDGTVVKTIWGSTTNGLLKANYWCHFGTYTITGLTSGTTYYCVVTVIAKNSSGSDTRSITTSLVTCP